MLGVVKSQNIAKESKKTHTKYSASTVYEIIDRINADVNIITFEGRAAALRNVLGINITEEDLKFAKNPEASLGPNGAVPIGRLVTIEIDGNNKKYLLNNNLTLTDWEIARQPNPNNEILDLDLSSADQQNVYDKQNTSDKQSSEQNKNDILSKLEELEKSGAISDQPKTAYVTKVTNTKITKNKDTGVVTKVISINESQDTKSKADKIKKNEADAAEFMDAIADKPVVEFDEEAAFNDLSADFAELADDLDELDNKRTRNGLESIDLIKESPATSESSDGQDSQVNAKDLDSDNSVVVEEDKCTVTVRYEGSIYRKKFKSDVVANRQAGSISDMIASSEHGVKEILDGPSSIFSKVG
jgi:hypothetical protein